MPTPSDMFMAEAQMRHTAAGFIGAKTGAITGIAANAAVVGVAIGPYVDRHGASHDRPVALTRLSLVFIPTTAFGTAQGVGFEVHVSDVDGDNFDTGSPTTVTAQRKKRDGYEAIPTSEIDIKVAATAAISGGDQAIRQSGAAPFFAAAGQGTLPAINAEWVADDGKPLVLQQGEGLIVRNSVLMGASGAGILWLGADFFRL